MGEPVTCSRCGLAQVLPEQVDFACEGCGKPVRSGINTVGMRMPCPGCARAIFVPEPGPARVCPYCRAPLEASRERCAACGERLRPADAGLARRFLALSPAPRIRLVAVSRIDPNPFQPRERMDPEGLRKLAQSVARFGVLVPLLLRPVGRRFQLVAGARRLEVSRRLGLVKAPAVVRSLSDSDALEIAYLENVQREDLNLVERALGFQNLFLEHAGVPQEELARRLGLSVEEMRELLVTLEMPVPLRRAFFSGRLSLRQVRALASLASANGSPVDHAKATQMVLAAALSDEETEALVRMLLAAKPDSA